MSFIIEAVERGLVPDILVRIGIKKLIRQRQKEISVKLYAAFPKDAAVL